MLAAYQPNELEFISKAVKNLRVLREVKAVVQTQYNSILTTAFPDSDLVLTKHSRTYYLVQAWD